MKTKVFGFITILIVIITGCGPARQVISSDDVNVSIRIDYRDESYTRQIVMQILRTISPKDLVTRRIDDGFETEATLVAETAEKLERITEIEQQLRNISGVLYLELRRPSRPVMEIVRNPRDNWR